MSTGNNEGPLSHEPPNLPFPIKQERSALSTRSLLRAAAELIGERGYERTTLVAIGLKAGYSRGLVTRRFGSKEGLLRALVAQIAYDWDRDVVAPLLSQGGTGDGLREFLAGVRGRYREEPMFSRGYGQLMLEAALSPDNQFLREHLGALYSSNWDLYKKLVVRGIASGVYRPEVDPTSVATLMEMTIRGAVYHFVYDPTFDIDGTLLLLDETLTLLIRNHEE